MPNKIKKIQALEILDSRGNPTVEVIIELNNGVVGKASIPSGASTGSYEAMELRDGDKKRYQGKGVLKAVRNVNTKIFNALKGKYVGEQKSIDKIMIDLDGTDNKSNLGANAILSVSLACARAEAKSLKLPLYEYIREIYHFSFKDYIFPKPMMNIINGGKHADSGLSFQEFMIMPDKKEFSDNLRMGAEIYHQLAEVLKIKGLSTQVGDEGGYAPEFSAEKEAPELILEAIKKAGYSPGKDVFLGLDAAATVFYNNNDKKYLLKLDQANLSDSQLIGLYNEWIDKYHFLLIEDGLQEDDWFGWQILIKKLGSKALIIGDDLFVTNIDRLKRGIKLKAANAIIIKPNQIGTLSETIQCIKLAQKNKLKVAIANRSGETVDTFIADLAIAIGADFIKAGSLSRGERLAKYNRLLEIECELKK